MTMAVIRVVVEFMEISASLHRNYISVDLKTRLDQFRRIAYCIMHNSGISKGFENLITRIHVSINNTEFQMHIGCHMSEKKPLHVPLLWFRIVQLTENT